MALLYSISFIYITINLLKIDMFISNLALLQYCNFLIMYLMKIKELIEVFERGINRNDAVSECVIYSYLIEDNEYRLPEIIKRFTVSFNINL